MTLYFCMLGLLSPDRQAQQQDGRDLRLSFVFSLLLLFSSVVSGCYWLKYGQLVRTHTDLLISMAKKMNDLLEDRRTITPTTMEEFLYPLERARDFVRIVSPRYGERQSLQAFTSFLDTYTQLVQETDRLRVLNEKPTDFDKRIKMLREQGERVKAILATEERTA